MKKLIAPTLALIIALSLGIMALYFSWSWHRSAQAARKHYQLAKNSIIGQGALSLAKTGEEQSLSFKHETPSPRGLSLQLRLRQETAAATSSPAQSGQQDDAAAPSGKLPRERESDKAGSDVCSLGKLVEQLHANIGVIRLYDADDSLLWEDDFANFVRYELDEIHGEAIITLGPCAPQAIRKAPLGSGRLALLVDQAPAAADDLALTLQARHALSGLETLQAQVARILSLAFFALAAMIALWGGNIFFRLRRAWHLRHLPPATMEAGRPILYLLSAYPRWSETFLRQDLRLLQSENIAIHPVALFPGDCEARPDWPKVSILNTNSAEPGSQQRKQLRQKISALLPATAHAQLSLFRHRQLRRRLLAECHEHRVVHIHAEFADLAALLAVDVAQYLGISYSVGIHAFDIHACKYPHRRLFSYASFITVCNQAAAQAFRRSCPAYKKRLHVLYHGILLDNWPFQPLRKLEGPAQLLFIGRLVPKKGIDILINAVCLLKQQHNEVHLTIVGDGPLKNELQNQAKNLAVDHLITWTGVLPPEEVRGYIHQANCLCMPSVVTADGDRDGIPNVVTEAMASGLPVVGSLAGSLDEVLNPDSGWPVVPLNPEQLAASINECCAQRDECERRCKNARQLIEKRFDAVKLAAIRADLFRNRSHDKA
jgi:colanic acid/amylovoran biosynthesis glycosyltransferase